MTISTKMFNEQTIANLGRLSEQLSGLQEQVASGKKPIKPSTDPVATAKLSAAKELEAGLARFRGNMNRIDTRLSETDVALGQVQTVITRLKELSIQASNDTLNDVDRLSIRKEVTQHKAFLVGLANTKDAQGQALFGGYMTNTAPFAMSLDGQVSYLGDTGMHSLPVSQSLSLATGLDGAASFMRVQTEQGPKSVFDIVAEFETSLKVMADRETSVKVQSPDGARLSFEIGRSPSPQTLRIEGSLGAADITVTMVSGTMRPMIEAINAQTSATGVSAQVSEDGNTIRLKSSDGEAFTISGFQADDIDGAEPVPSRQITVQQIVGDTALGEPVVLVDQDNALKTSVAGLDSVIVHVASARAQVGAYAATAEIQSDMLSRQEMMITETLSGIEDADLTAVVTELQSLLVNRDALRQVFAKVGQQSLFDLIR
ncbi:flagellar hook-associated protein FlgL [Lentibacter algarum]|jgi:flagellar hook-associated protein 3 FlgL|uniref:flagellar hook-associated protein FlgL n=1 Tax=Lentibacter algarum TaxID=576131 RepID=UPI0024921A46|nr:flagellar hook-associated protein FlgL [Lentibacter algarum]